jgi:hypothetical protein
MLQTHKLTFKEEVKSARMEVIADPIISIAYIPIADTVCAIET